MHCFLDRGCQLKRIKCMLGHIYNQENFELIEKGWNKNKKKVT